MSRPTMRRALAACLALGAAVLAAMMALFALLVHVPRVFESPGDQLEWIMLGVALSLSGAAWLVRKYAA